LRFKEYSQNIIAQLSVSPADDVGPQVSILVLLNRNIEVDTFYDLSKIEGHDQYSEFFHLNDSTSILRTAEMITVLDDQFISRNSFTLPNELSFHTLLVGESQLYFYPDFYKDTLYHFDLNGNLLDARPVKAFNGIFSLQGFTFTVNHNFIYKYNLDSIKVIDSLVLTRSSDHIEAKVVDDTSFALITYNLGERASIEIWNTELELIVHSESWTTVETNLNIIQEGENYIEWGRCYFQDFYVLNVLDTLSVRYFQQLPFIRSFQLNKSNQLNRPTLEITDLDLFIPPGSDSCLAGLLEPEDCRSSTIIPFQFTISNTGNRPIQNLAYYTDAIYGFNCYSDHTYRYLENISLEPGQETIILDTAGSSYFKNGDLFNVYIAAPNHLIDSFGFIKKSVFLGSTSVYDRSEIKNINVYPNPAVTTINLSGLEIQPEQQFELYNFQGQLLQRGRIHETLINVAPLPKGYYLLRLIGEEEIRVATFLKS